MKKFEEYEKLMEIIKKRRSCREFSNKPLPEGALENIIEAARWAPSGANSQPWTFILVTDKGKIAELFEAHVNDNMDYAFWMEQQRCFEMRHPGFMVDAETADEALRIKQTRKLWREVPGVIVVLGDGRKQWGSLICTSTSGSRNCHMTDSLANASTLIHLTAASLGLNTQWVSVHVEETYKRILNIPDSMMVHTLIPVGYPEKPVGGSWREKTEDLIHYNEYDRSRHLSNKESIDRLVQLRNRTRAPYKPMME
jgi:nitroreductase